MNHHLTARERQAVTLRARGYSYRSIGRQMNISTERVSQLLHHAGARLEHARAFSREKEFRASYQRERSLVNLRAIANAFFHLAKILP